MTRSPVARPRRRQTYKRRKHMNTVRIGATVDLEVLSCWVCGCTFGVPYSVKQNMKSRGETLFCPKGCRLGLGEPDWKRRQAQLERQLSTAKRRADNLENRAESAERSLSATKGVVTRLKNRASKGVCPCCNRHFSNLQRHMETQHPDYTKSE